MKEERAFDLTNRNVQRVLEICRRPGEVLILMQDNPDPDALASAAALRELLARRLKRKATVGYGGVCGRAENRAMIDLLHIHAERLAVSDLGRFETVCLVDAQPQAGNNILVAAAPPHVVIDHHLLPRKITWHAELTDIRPDYGATSSILYEYLIVARIVPGAALATALFYGIQSDTQELGRESSQADVVAYRDLFLLADKKKLARIHRAPVPPVYFKMLMDGLEHCDVAGTTVISQIKSCQDPDMVAEVADLLIRLDGMDCAVCYGLCGTTIYVSARVTTKGGNAAKRIREGVAGLGVGGGHRRMAGGQVPVDGDVARCLAVVRNRIFAAFAPNKEPVPLADLVCQ